MENEDDQSLSTLERRQRLLAVGGMLVFRTVLARSAESAGLKRPQTSACGASATQHDVGLRADVEVKADSHRKAWNRRV
jgi:hypothetical protein